MPRRIMLSVFTIAVTAVTAGAADLPTQSRLGAIFAEVACPMCAACTAIAERLREKTDFLKRIKLFLAVQSHSQKYFASPVGQIISTNSRHPTPPEGRIAIITDVGEGCGGRGSVERAMGCRAGRKACERSPSERTRDVAADGKIVWS